MKLATSTGMHGGEYPSELAEYQAIAFGGFKYINYNFPNMPLNNPRSMDYMSDRWEQVALGHLELMKQAGLTPIQAHAPFAYPRPDEAVEPLLDATIRVIECCRVMGIPYVVLHPHAAKGMSMDEFTESNRSFFRRLIPVVEKTGVMPLIENIGHLRDPHLVRNGHELRHLIEAVDHPLFGACWDIGHANHILTDQSESIRVLGSLLKGLHVQDNLGDPDPKNWPWPMDMHTFPLFGSTNFDGVIQTLLDIGYEGYFTFESDTPKPQRTRPPFIKDGVKIDRLSSIFPELRRHSLVFLHETGRLMLEAYDCFEE